MFKCLHLLFHRWRCTIFSTTSSGMVICVLYILPLVKVNNVNTYPGGITTVFTLPQVGMRWHTSTKAVINSVVLTLPSLTAAITHTQRHELSYPLRHIWDLYLLDISTSIDKGSYYFYFSIQCQSFLYQSTCSDYKWVIRYWFVDITIPLNCGHLVINNIPVERKNHAIPGASRLTHMWLQVSQPMVVLHRSGTSIGPYI